MRSVDVKNKKKVDELNSILQDIENAKTVKGTYR